MIEAAATATASEPKRAAKEADGADALPQFSYALAAATLEQRAGASLKTHGGVPSKAAETARGERSAARNENPSQRAGAPQASPQTGVRGEAAAPKQSTEITQTSPPAHPAESRGPDLNPSSTSAFAGVNGAVAGIAITGAPGAGAKASPQSEGAARDLASRTAVETLKAARASAPRGTPSTHDFARLLARKLDDGATSFHLRLDPPELGRVEAKLLMGEDGKAALALAFDNQAALDLFSRDEAQLRAALTAAGFNAGGADISFSLNQRSAETETEPAAIASAQRLPIASEHSFLAPVSTGVMDVSV